MENLSDVELKKVTGGGISWGALIGIGAGITFLIGLIDGHINLK